ncbi:TIGR03943 family putative permease subunit [Intestinibacillus sp. Marseille-P6563]|uniref:TIGR03943 family putative permease subunit n=1 Tax=Intestinibacillus sp. Marseille-P6563 TaxID=2364792 RepID=UPI000F049D7A|nr:GTP-binding protein [Intestinibacillus sp. Marseille-P6563]
MKPPAYIFIGLLESGKTTFIKEVIADPNFTLDEKTLLIRCEDGIEEYDEEFLEKYNIVLVDVEDEDELTTAALKKAHEAEKPDRVVIEFNGMWDLGHFVDEVMPNCWELYQIVASVCGPTFELYSNNLGPKMFEHITSADLIVFNRCTQKDKDYLHQRNIRAMNPRATIFLDDVDGNSEDYRDNMVMPFDLDADEIDIRDEDFGLWYVDASSEPQKYDGKTVRFKAHVLVTPQLPKGWIVPGRHGMVCCADDIQFLGFACNAGDRFPNIENKGWYTLTAHIHVEELPQYKGAGPVLDLVDIQPAEPPQEEVVYFN